MGQRKATVTVTTDGVDTTYQARVLDALCGATAPHVGYSGVWALLDAAGCKTHFQAGASLTEAPHIGASSGCYYPFYGDETRRDWWVLVYVAEAGPLRFSFEDCPSVAPTTATLFDGVTEVSGTTAPPGECPNLTVDISKAGTYPLNVASEAAADSSFFSLHIERAN